MQGRALIALLAVLYGSAFVAGFSENLLNMALLSIMGDFSVDSVTAQWLVTGYMIVATVVVAAMAYFYRRVKLRPLFLAAAVLSLAGSLSGLFAANFPMLLVARLVQAVGTGIFIPLMMNTVLAVTPKRRLGTYMSIGSAMITFGPAFAPVVCGGIVTAFGWRYVFVVPAACMAVLIVACFAFVRNLENEPAHLDVPSVALSAVALFTMSYGLTQLSSDPAAAAVTLAVFALSAAVFIVRQLRCEHPLIDLAPMRRITFWPAMLLTVVSMMSTFSMSVLLPQYFEGAIGLTAFLAGVVMLVPVLANTAVTLFAGRLFDRFGEWPLLPIGFGIAAIGFVLLATMAPALSLPLSILGSTLAFSGIALVFSPSQTAGLRTLSPQENPFGVALTTTLVQVAACIGPALYTGVMSSVEGSAGAAGAHASLAAAEGFAAAMAVAAGIVIAGFAIAVVYAIAAKRRAAAAAREGGSPSNVMRLTREELKGGEADGE